MTLLHIRHSGCVINAGRSQNASTSEEIVLTFVSCSFRNEFWNRDIFFFFHLWGSFSWSYFIFRTIFNHIQGDPSKHKWNQSHFGYVFTFSEKKRWNLLILIVLTLNPNSYLSHLFTVDHTPTILNGDQVVPRLKVFLDPLQHYTLTEHLWQQFLLSWNFFYWNFLHNLFLVSCLYKIINERYWWL